MKEIEVTDQGAKFIAEIKGLGNATIISYGFIWIENITQIEYSLSIDKTPQEGNIYAKVNTDLIEGRSYSVKPYIQTNDHTIYGDDLYFISKGSSNPNN